MKQRKCKSCGRLFFPKNQEWFCSTVCSITGNFVSGGGDTSKPLSKERQQMLSSRMRANIPQKNSQPRKSVRICNGKDKYPRVHYMFSLPIEKRWDVAKQFTDEEYEYYKRLVKSKQREEYKLDMIIDWDRGASGHEEVCYEDLIGGSLGASDDGTI